MNIQRPQRRNESSCTTYFVGLLSGLSVGLVVAVIILITFESVKSKKKLVPFMTKVFQFYWFWIYIVLANYFHAITIFLWRRYGITYVSIHKDLTPMDFLLFGSLCFVLCLSTLFAQLFIKSNLKDPYSWTTVSDFLPLLAFGIVFLVMVCRCERWYSATRSFFRRTVIRALCAPFYEVTFAEAFLVDQLTSQIASIRIIEMYICFFGFNKFYDVDDHCSQHAIFQIISLILGVLPFVTKLLQTFRRLIDDTERIHAFNCVKFILTVMAVIARSTYLIHSSRLWLGVAISSSLIATLANLYWDIVIDWGLFQRKSLNPYLRDHICIPDKRVYYAAMVTNTLLRFVWIQILVKFDLPLLGGEIVMGIFSILEIVRRTISNFFKLEYAHVTELGRR